MRPSASQALAALTGVLILKAASASVADPVSPADLAEVRVFLDQYTALSRSQSPDFYDLYAERATVHVRAQTAANELAFPGRAYKAWSRQLLLAHRTAIDTSEFHGVAVEQRADRLVIRAKRFSASRCFWDADYQVTLEREASSLKIIDERLTTAPSSICQIRQETSFPELPPNAGNPWPTQSPAAWHPMTQEQIARSALKRAREVAAARSGEKPQPAAIASTLNSGSPQITRLAESDPLLVTPPDK